MKFYVCQLECGILGLREIGLDCTDLEKYVAWSPSCKVSEQIFPKVEILRVNWVR